METPNSGCWSWSELPMDILRSLFERLSFVDFHRAKIVCLNWYLCSKQTLHRKRRSQWLMLFPEDGCVLYNPEEDRFYKSKRDFSGIRFLANSGNWFLVLDSRSNLYIIDAFSERRINLPPLESIKGDNFCLKRVGDKEFSIRYKRGCHGSFSKGLVDLRGFLWVDEKKGEYSVAWFFHINAEYIAFCKKGEDQYSTITTRINVQNVKLQGISDMVLRGGILYIYTLRRFIRVLDISGREGFKDLSENDVAFRPFSPSSDDETRYEEEEELSNGAIFSYNIAVTTSGVVLFVESIFDEATTTSERHRNFRLYKKDPNPDPHHLTYGSEYVEVYSLGDEALFLDLGITVSADHTLGIEPNSIYFTRHDRLRQRKRDPQCPDICVFNLATKTLKLFPNISNLNLKDARWFIPS